MSFFSFELGVFSCSMALLLNVTFIDIPRMCTAGGQASEVRLESSRPRLAS
jgi:hypothetical protein